MKSNEISRKGSKVQETTKSQENQKSHLKLNRFDLLYENALIMKKKLDLIRAKNYFEMQERMIPAISKRAKQINRPKELFYKRLYNSHLNKNKEKLRKAKATKEKTDKNTLSVDEDGLYIINNKAKNEAFRKLYKSSNLAKSVSFNFTPTINDNSRKIASRIKTNSKERLLSLSEKQKQNLKEIQEKREKKKEMLMKEQKEKELFKLNNNTYKPMVNVQRRKWVDKLYEKGINSIKEKQEKTKNEMIRKEKEYLNYPFAPKLNRSYTYMTIFKAKNFGKKNRRGGLTTSTPDVYERNKKWKDFIEKKNDRIRTDIKKDKLNDSENYFSPNLNTKIMGTDISFIGKNRIEYETFLSQYNYSMYKKKLEIVNYRKINIPPKKRYKKNLVVEFVSEFDSNCPTNSGTIKQTMDRRPLLEIQKNREKLKISDFFEGNPKLQSSAYFKENKGDDDDDIYNNKSYGAINLYVKNKNKRYCKNRNDNANLSFFKAVNSLVNKIK